MVAFNINKTLCQAVLAEGNNEDQAALADMSTTPQDQHMNEAGRPFMLPAVASVYALCCMVLPLLV